MKAQYTNVNIHLEKINDKYNLLHIGISFNDGFKTLRFDYRPFNSNNNYDTTNMNRRHIATIFPDLYIPNDIIIPNNMDVKTLYWGRSNKTITEILEFEKTLHQIYILGIYDCRHYVNKLTEWTLNNPTPIWYLHELWNET